MADSAADADLPIWNEAVLVQLGQLVAQGDVVGAADVLRPFVQCYPTHPDILREAGLVSVALQDYQGAIVYLDAAIRAGDHDLNTLGMLADVCHHLKCPQVVIDHLGRCAHPALASRWARALAMLFRFQDAETVLAHMPPEAIDPIVSEVRTIIAVGRYAPDRLQIAESAAQIAPGIPMVWGQLAAARQSFGDTAGALAAYRQALVLDVENPAWHYNYALSLLSAGDYRAGFAEYEWRMHPKVERKLAAQLPRNPGGLPLWRGESLNGKVLLVYAEGGLGDCILGLRWLTDLLAELGPASQTGQTGQLRVWLPSSLVSICQRTWPSVRFIASEGVEAGKQATDGADFWVPSLSLPQRFAVTADRVPYREGYLQADPVRVQHWQEKIQTACAADGKSKAVALVWHGRMEHDYERTRAFDPAELAALLPADAFPVVVQMDATSDDLACFSNAMWVGPDIASFDDTAAILSACGHALLCDTSVAHLAGALGLPATVLIRNRFIWQWRCRAHGQSIWYSQPTVRFVDSGRSEEIVYMRAAETADH